MDAKLREIFITASLLLPIIAIGFYPKLVTQTYDVKTVAVAAQVRNALPVVAQQGDVLYSGNFVAPQIPATSANLLGAIEPSPLQNKSS